MKKYEIFAGVNGEGKSTLYATKHVVAGENRVNTDEIHEKYGRFAIIRKGEIVRLSANVPSWLT